MTGPISAREIGSWIDEDGFSGTEPSRRPFVQLIVSNSNSSVFKARLPGIAGNVAIKVCLDPAAKDPSPAVATEEYTALRTVWEASESHNTFRVPRPYGVLLKRGCLVTEWVAGRNLGERWVRQWYSVRRMAADAAAAGCWLKQFHASGPLVVSALDTSSLLNQLLRLIEQARPRFQRHPLVLRGVNALREISGAAATCQLSKSWLHGDFKPNNILLLGDEPIGIDIQTIEEDIALRDVVQFLFETDLLCMEPKGILLARTRVTLERAFLAGYFGDLSAVPDIALYWLRLNLALIVWAGHNIGDRPDLRGRYLTALIKRIVKRLLTEIPRDDQCATVLSNPPS